MHLALYYLFTSSHRSIPSCQDTYAPIYQEIPPILLPLGLTNVWSHNQVAFCRFIIKFDFRT